MRPRTKLPIPNPTGSEFENFDRLTGILLSKSSKKKARKKAAAKSQRKRRLPRP